MAREKSSEGTMLRIMMFEDVISDSKPTAGLLCVSPCDSF